MEQTFLEQKNPQNNALLLCNEQHTRTSQEFRIPFEFRMSIILKASDSATISTPPSLSLSSSPPPPPLSFPPWAPNPTHLSDDSGVQRMFRKRHPLQKTMHLVNRPVGYTHNSTAALCFPIKRVHSCHSICSLTNTASKIVPLTFMLHCQCFQNFIYF